jgi:nitroreductase
MKHLQRKYEKSLNSLNSSLSLSLSLSHVYTNAGAFGIQCCRITSGSGVSISLSLPLSLARTHICILSLTHIHTNAGAMFGYPMLQDYDWFWRLDSDSFILGPLDQDPFRRMAQVPY